MCHFFILIIVFSNEARACAFVEYWGKNCLVFNVFNPKYYGNPIIFPLAIIYHQYIECVNALRVMGLHIEKFVLICCMWGRKRKPLVFFSKGKGGRGWKLYPPRLFQHPLGSYARTGSHVISLGENEFIFANSGTLSFFCIFGGKGK